MKIYETIITAFKINKCVDPRTVVLYKYENVSIVHK